MHVHLSAHAARTSHSVTRCPRLDLGGLCLHWFTSHAAARHDRLHLTTGTHERAAGALQRKSLAPGSEASCASAPPISSTQHEGQPQCRWSPVMRHKVPVFVQYQLNVTPAISPNHHRKTRGKPGVPSNEGDYAERATTVAHVKSSLSFTALSRLFISKRAQASLREVYRVESLV